MALLQSIGIGFAKFLRVYLVVLVVGGVLYQIQFHYAFNPGMYLASSVGILIGGAIGTSTLPTLLGLWSNLVPRGNSKEESSST
jgi:hypothetical protein